MKTYEELLEKLSENNIKYILVGGLAVDLCGFSRATEDVDILIESSKENINSLLKCLESFGEGSAKELKIEDFTPEEGCIRINEDFPLDIFTIMTGNTYNDLLPYSEIFITENKIEIRYLNKEGLIKLKKHSVRPKDQLDVKELKRLK
ncbi:MAG: nucleotidyl transferase AbiEii/AbiGii toxin family protein [bacterium]